MANFDEDKMLPDDDKPGNMDEGIAPSGEDKLTEDDKILEGDDLIEGEEDEENLDAWELESDLEE